MFHYGIDHGFLRRSDLSDKIKQEFFQDVAMSEL